MASSGQGASTPGRQKMVGVIAALLIVAAVLAIVQMYRSSQPHVGIQINAPPGSSEKMQAMKEQQGAKPGGDVGASDNIRPQGR